MRGGLGDATNLQTHRTKSSKILANISKEKSQKYSHVLFSCFSSYILGDLRLFKGQFFLCKKTSGLGLLTQLSSEEDHDGNVPSLDPQKVYPTKSQEVGSKTIHVCMNCLRIV